MQNSIFFPQVALDEWIVEGSVDLQGNELTILAEGRKYQLQEAVHVLREVTGGPDPHDLVGRVKPKNSLEETGAEILEGSMILGDNAYDISTGWSGTPVGAFKAHQASVERAQARKKFPSFPDEEVCTDEDLLARVLLKAMK